MSLEDIEEMNKHISEVAAVQCNQIYCDRCQKETTETLHKYIKGRIYTNKHPQTADDVIWFCDACHDDMEKAHEESRKMGLD